MEYKIKASSISNKDASIQIKQSEIAFGTTPEAAETLPNPAELFLGAFASCMLKNVERFSSMMKFKYEKAEVNVAATRTEKPLKMDNLIYKLTVFSEDENLNISLLKKILKNLVPSTIL